jgi:hypothetical protein
LVVLPDTQYYSETYPAIFDSQTQWISSNKIGMNVVFVTHEGDIVNTNTVTQWRNADSSMSTLDEANIPWGVLPGNHDLSGGSTNYNTYFSYSRFSGLTWYGGAYQNVNTNSYELFAGGLDDYLIFHFQYQPSTPVLAWANATIASYPGRRVIVTTHDYMNTDGTRTATGNNIWNKFVKPHADQVFLVLCGHMHGENKKVDVVNGHIVYQLLADYQSRSNGGNGWLRILEFNPSDDEINVKTYSPYLGQYETDADSSFTLSYDMNTDPVIVYIKTFDITDNYYPPEGGNVKKDKTLRIYSGVSDGETPSIGLTVTTSYRLQGGSWVSSAAFYNQGQGYWYVDWTIPGDAAIGLYDVRVVAGDPDGGSVMRVDAGKFRVDNADPVIVYIKTFDITDNYYPPEGGNVKKDKTLRIYSGVSDGETPSIGLTVTTSYRLQGGSWVSSAAFYNQGQGYWYVDWTIPGDAAIGLYDVRVVAGDPDGGSVMRVDAGKFRVE